jgi:predicted O-methyltransferase YrrM
MYFLAGLETNGKGKLLTFEPNETWRRMAVACLEKIGTRFISTAGTFEATIDEVLPAGESIDLAFIDAIHTRAFVMPQLERVVARCSDHALVILDDINFSDDMRDCWNQVARDPRFVSSVALGQRVGILEYARR